MQSEHCFIYISTFRMSRGITRGNRISLSTVSWARLGNLFQMSLNIICLSIFVSCFESQPTVPFRGPNLPFKFKQDKGCQSSNILCTWYSLNVKWYVVSKCGWRILLACCHACLRFSKCIDDAVDKNMINYFCQSSTVWDFVWDSLNPLDLVNGWKW